MQQHKLAKYCDEILDEYLLKRSLDNVPVSLLAIQVHFALVAFLKQRPIAYFVVSPKETATDLSW